MLTRCLALSAASSQAIMISLFTPSGIMRIGRRSIRSDRKARLRFSFTRSAADGW